MAKKVLGRGLNALFGSRKTEKPAEKAVLSEQQDKKEEKSNALPDSDSVILKDESAVISEKKEELSVKDNVVLSEKNEEKKESISENKDSSSKNNSLAVKNEEVIEGKTKDIIFSDEKKAADDSKNKKEENLAEKPSEKTATEITDGFLKINEKAMSGQEDDNKEQPKQEKVIRIPIERIRPNMYQPRRNFNETALQELAESIKSSGLLQPITVWKDPDRVPA